MVEIVAEEETENKKGMKCEVFYCDVLINIHKL